MNSWIIKYWQEHDRLYFNYYVPGQWVRDWQLKQAYRVCECCGSVVRKPVVYKRLTSRP